MKLIKVQGTGPVLNVNFEEPLKVHTNLRIALLVWHFHHLQHISSDISELEKVACFEMRCKVTDNNVPSTSKNLLFAVCSPDFSRARESLLPFPSLKGCFDPKEKIFVEINDSIQSISNISIEITTNLGDSKVLQKVNSSIYLIIN
jgi:hypothetical protein